MRPVFAALTALGIILATHAAAAERRMFIIGSNAEGHRGDRCLANGEKCGESVATAYCRSQQFVTAKSFQKVDRDDITGAIPTTGAAGACQGNKCAEFVAIECTR